jgi:GntR family transcriptional regulator, transcriptional repressor for pyruvate dehydrogenase complex
MNEFGPILPYRLAGQVATLISNRILSGKISPGARMPPERELALTLKVSRPTVREAIHVLEALGLLEVRHGDGTYVSKNPSVFPPRILKQLVESDDLLLLDMLEVRKEFEVRNAELAAEHATEEEICRLARIVGEIDMDLREGREESQRDIDFHLTVAEASHSRVRLFITTSMLVAHSETLRMARLRQIERDPQVVQDFLHEHRAVYLGIEAREPQRARDAMLAHLNAASVRQAGVMAKNS